MKKQGGGKIINVASIDGFNPEPFVSVYSISKAGVRMITKAFAMELAPRQHPGQHHRPRPHQHEDDGFPLVRISRRKRPRRRRPSWKSFCRCIASAIPMKLPAPPFIWPPKPPTTPRERKSSLTAPFAVAQSLTSREKQCLDQQEGLVLTRMQRGQRLKQ